MAIERSQQRKERLHVRNRETNNPDALRALWTLSNFPSEVSVQSVSDAIREAPDPETACRAITSQLNEHSDALTRKWRKVIRQTWLDKHPYVSDLLDLPLTSRDIVDVIATQDALALLKEFHAKPASVIWENGDRVVDTDDIQRLIAILPSMRSRYIPQIENEWSCITLRRLRALLQSLRLVRIVRGTLTVVHSRYARFLRLPPPVQYYVLWHADVYHVNWSEFAGQWGPYVHLIQDYLPLLWDVVGDVEGGEFDNVHDVTKEIIEVYRPLWQQEGLFNHTSEKKTFIDVYEESALPGILERLIVCDVMARYGVLHAGLSLVSVDSSRALLMERGDFMWTQVGATLLGAERDQILPCGMKLLA